MSLPPRFGSAPPPRCLQLACLLHSGPPTGLTATPLNGRTPIFSWRPTAGNRYASPQRAGEAEALEGLLGHTDFFPFRHKGEGGGRGAGGIRQPAAAFAAPRSGGGSGGGRVI